MSRINYRKNEDFFKTWTPKMSYVLGFMYADGCIGDTRVLRFSNKNLFLLENVKKFMEVENPIYSRVFRSKNRKEASGYILQIGSKKMYKDLISLGVTERKSLTSDFPSVPKKFLAYFFQGLIDGDGSIYVEKIKSKATRDSYIHTAKYKKSLFETLNIQIASGSDKFLNSILKIFPDFYKNTKAKYIRIKSKKAVNFGKYLYKDILVFSPKCNNYLNYIKKYVDNTN